MHIRPTDIDTGGGGGQASGGTDSDVASLRASGRGGGLASLKGLLHPLLPLTLVTAGTAAQGQCISPETSAPEARQNQALCPGQGWRKREGCQHGDCGPVFQPELKI